MSSPTPLKISLTVSPRESNTLPLEMTGHHYLGCTMKNNELYMTLPRAGATCTMLSIKSKTRFQDMDKDPAEPDGALKGTTVILILPL